MEKKKKVKINWSKSLTEYTNIESSKNSYLDAPGFYSILSGIYDIRKKIFQEITLLYIGSAFTETIRESLLFHTDFLSCVNRFLEKEEKQKVLIMGGVINNSSESPTQNFYNAVEQCLINTNQPVCNSSYIENSSGDMIEIINEGDYYPLKEKSICRI